MGLTKIQQGSLGTLVCDGELSGRWARWRHLDNRFTMGL